MARDLRGFIKLLEERGQLQRITALVDSDLEIAEISNRMLQQGGPGLIFESKRGVLSCRGELVGYARTDCWCEYAATAGVRDTR